MREMKLLSPTKKRSVRKYSIQCQNRLVTNSNQLWESDIKYAYVAGTRQTAYILSVIDVFDRELIAHKVVKACTAETACEVLLESLYKRGIKGDSENLIVRTDNGSQYISHKFGMLCLKEKINHERIPVRSPNYNAHIESFHRYFEDECLTGKIYLTFEELKEDIGRHINNYNTKRIHSSINYMTPREFYMAKGLKFKDDLMISL